jgi:hypothetical protein
MLYWPNPLHGNGDEIHQIRSHLLFENTACPKRENMHKNRHGGFVWRVENGARRLAFRTHASSSTYPKPISSIRKGMPIKNSAIRYGMKNSPLPY